MTAPLKVTQELLGRADLDGYDGQLDIDVGNLTAFDPSPINMKSFKKDPNGVLLGMSRDIVQSLVGKVFELPTAPAPIGRLAKLPPPTTMLPRAKPLPKPRPLTKWAQFAQEKGITKRKRSSVKYDEMTGEWRRRHGYGRADDDGDMPIIEARASDEPGEDPFGRAKKEKKERVKKNDEQRLANLKRAHKAGPGGKVPTTLLMSTKFDGEGAPMKRARQDVAEMSQAAGVSTASMGKFDLKSKGEKGNRKAMGTKRQFRPLVDPSEGDANKKLVDRMLREKSDDIVDVKRAVNRVQVEREAGNRAAKAAGVAKGGKKGAGGGARKEGKGKRGKK